MKEYGELIYMDLFKEYSFRTREGIRETVVRSRDDIGQLNKLARFGWRLISKDGNKYLMERDVVRR